MLGTTHELLLQVAALRNCSKFPGEKTLITGLALFSLGFSPLIVILPWAVFGAVSNQRLSGNLFSSSSSSIEALMRLEIQFEEKRRVIANERTNSLLSRHLGSLFKGLLSDSIVF